jgi:hypothetical protein
MAAIHALRERGWSAICFVPTMPLADGVVLDVHKLHMIRAQLPDAALTTNLAQEFGGAFTAVGGEAMRVQYRFDNEEAARIKYFINFVLPPDARQGWLSATFERLFGSERDFATTFYMDRDDIRLLAKLGMLGTHGHGHLPYAGMTPDDACDDMIRSLDILDGIAGRKVSGISYPYGTPSAINETTGEHAASLGLAYGFTMSGGLNTAVDSPLMLKRIDTNDVAAVLRHEPAGV